MVWIVIGVFALIALIDLSPLIRQRKWRAMAAFISMFAVALTLSVLSVKNIEVPSTMYAWGDLIKWLGLGYTP
jgi:membrane-associated PAP2 superfamily phosphatase